MKTYKRSRKSRKGKKGRKHPTKRRKHFGGLFGYSESDRIQTIDKYIRAEIGNNSQGKTFDIMQKNPDSIQKYLDTINKISGNNTYKVGNSLMKMQILKAQLTKALPK